VSRLDLTLAKLGLEESSVVREISSGAHWVHRSQQRHMRTGASQELLSERQGS
jgi:hypothetical protein